MNIYIYVYKISLFYDILYTYIKYMYFTDIKYYYYIIAHDLFYPQLKQNCTKCAIFFLISILKVSLKSMVLFLYF